MSTRQPFRFFDLPKELRLMVYEHLHTQQHVVQQISSSSESSGQVEFRYMTFAVGTLATCKLMRDEVHPFFVSAFVKAYQTDGPATTHTFQMVNHDMFKQAAKCAKTIFGLMRVFGDDTFEQSFSHSRDDLFEYVLNLWDAKTRVVIESRWANFASHAVEVYKKFGRRLLINMRWYEGSIYDAAYLNWMHSLPLPDATRHLFEFVFDSKPKLKSETDEEGS